MKNLEAFFGKAEGAFSRKRARLLRNVVCCCCVEHPYQQAKSIGFEIGEAELRDKLEGDAAAELRERADVVRLFRTAL